MDDIHVIIQYTNQLPYMAYNKGNYINNYDLSIVIATKSNQLGPLMTINKDG